MGKTLAVLTCSLGACILFAGCSRATPPQPSRATSAPPGPGVLIIDAADSPSLGQTADSYRIGTCTIPAGDIEALATAISAARRALPKDDPNVPRLIVRADAEVAAHGIAPAVMLAIKSGYDFVDLDANLPARTSVLDPPPPDPIIVRVVRSEDGQSATYEMTGIARVIASEDELRQLLKWKGQRVGFYISIVATTRGEVKDELLLTAYSQAIRAGFKRFGRSDRRSRTRRPPRPNYPLPRPDVPVTGKSNLFDIPINANHVVYLCDRSGSLAPVFQQVLHELVRSVSRLRADQDFAVLMMACEKPIELNRGGLLPGSMQNKLKAARFLQDVTPTGATSLLPSLKRAFELLGAADKSKPGKAIFILTDGDFSGLSGGSVYTASDGRKLCGNEAVIEYLRDHNADKAVQVNTILLYNKEDYAVKVHKQIAAENGGRFRLVTDDE